MSVLQEAEIFIMKLYVERRIGYYYPLPHPLLPVFIGQARRGSGAETNLFQVIDGTFSCPNAREVSEITGNLNCTNHDDRIKFEQMVGTVEIACYLVSAPDPFRAWPINIGSRGWGKTKERVWHIE